MSTDSNTMLGVLDLTEVTAEVFDRAFVATTGYCPWPKAYGGDMVAQSIAAANLTCDKTLHSVHSYFMRPVEVSQQVRYEVEMLRDGRNYATRGVRAFQQGKPVFVMFASFACAANGGSYQSAMPSLPQPEVLPSAADYLAGAPVAEQGVAAAQARHYWSYGRSFDMRHVPGPLYLRVDGETVAHQAVWVKSFAELPDDDRLHQAALAYACDYTIIEPTLRVLGHYWSEPGLVTASLDHAMWFHRRARVDQWLLYAQQSAAAVNGRGLGMGSFFTRDGTLIATVIQEAMIAAPESR